VETGGVGSRRLPRPGIPPRRAIRQWALALPAAVLLVAFILVPLLTLGVFSFFGSTRPLSDFTVDNYLQLFATPLYLSMLQRTLLIGVGVTAVTVLIGWPVGWAISRMSRRAQMTILTLVIIPYLTSFLLLVYAIFVLLLPNGPIMAPLSFFGIAEAGDTVVYTPVATFIMLVYESLPLMILVMYSTSDRITNEQIDAARSLGASRFDIARTVIAPLSAGGLVTASTLVFIPVLGAFAESSVLGGPNGLLYGNLISDQITITNNQPLAAALSFVLLLAVIVIAIALYLLGRSFARSRKEVST
jgi:spermidine/putrescine transport system permease protein